MGGAAPHPTPGLILLALGVGGGGWKAPAGGGWLGSRALPLPQRVETLTFRNGYHFRPCSSKVLAFFGLGLFGDTSEPPVRLVGCDVSPGPRREPGVLGGNLTPGPKPMPTANSYPALREGATLF